MEIRDGFACCILREINGLSGLCAPASKLLDIVREEFYYEDEITLDNVEGVFSGVVVFTGANSRKAAPAYSERFAKFIENNQLGYITQAAPTRNPNSGNYVTVYLWHVNHQGLLAWIKKNR